MYSVLAYSRMAACSVRMDAYARAIARVVKPGSVVIDLGAGTGICSLLAARAGARVVHAIEPNPGVWLIPELAVENAIADRIVIHALPSFEVELEERADVVISDLRGSCPITTHHLAALRDAKKRLLKPGGVLMPLRDRLFVAAVEAREMGMWIDDANHGFTDLGLSSRAIQHSLSHDVFTDRDRELRSNDVLTTAESWATLEYGTTEGPIEGHVVLVARRSGTVRGLALWFEATIIDGLGFDNAPGSSLAYARYYLPMLEPVTLDEGDRLDVVLRTDENGERWGWDTSVTSAGGTHKARFRQSTFLGMPTSPEALLRGSPKHTPVRTARGARIQRILELMDGVRSVGEIADALEKTEPTIPRATLLDEVRGAIERYSR